MYKRTYRPENIVAIIVIVVIVDVRANFARYHIYLSLGCYMSIWLLWSNTSSSGGNNVSISYAEGTGAQESLL